VLRPRLGEDRPRLGVLAFGDSITNGGGELQWSVALQSWALWVARGLGLPYTGYAVDGAGVGDVVAEQIPAFERRSADPGGRFQVGCLYIGVNDVRAVDWNARAFAEDFGNALRFLIARCDRVLAVTAPLDLGRPRAGAKVRELNGVIERAAGVDGGLPTAVHGAQPTPALVLDLSDFGARNLVMADHVHPTALGQIAVAERALSVLERDGMRVTARPSSLVAYETTWWSRLRGDCTYSYRHLKVTTRAAALSAYLRLASSTSPSDG
jgi:lysophospholipase L1-like esterase